MCFFFLYLIAIRCFHRFAFPHFLCRSDITVQHCIFHRYFMGTENYPHDLCAIFSLHGSKNIHIVQGGRKTQGLNVWNSVVKKLNIFRFFLPLVTFRIKCWSEKSCTMLVKHTRKLTVFHCDWVFFRPPLYIFSMTLSSNKYILQNNQYVCVFKVFLSTLGANKRKK